MKKVELKNFQSIKEASLKISPFTVIVGPTDSGKSAVIRAINAAVYNEPGTYYIQRGTNKCRIFIDDGENTFEYSKGPSPAYYINDKKYSAIGQGQFSEIAKLGYAQIKADGLKIRPQVSFQWDQPFLISDSYPETTSAIILGALSDSAKVNKAKRLVEKDAKAIKSKIKHKENDLDIISKKLMRYTNWDYASSLVEVYKNLYTEGNKLQLEYAEVRQIVSDLKDIESQKTEDANMLKICHELLEGLHLEHLNNECAAYKVLQDEVINLRGLDKIIKGLKLALSKLLDKLASLAPYFKTLSSSAGTLDQLGSLIGAHTEIKTNEVQLLGKKEEYKDIAKKMKDYSNCPLCGAGL